MVTAFQTTVIADVYGNGDVTEDITFFGLLFEGDLLIGSNDSAGFAKETVVCILGRVHAGLRSVMNSTIVSHNCRLPSVNYFTYEGVSAEIAGSHPTTHHLRRSKIQSRV
jgi:hypothetical protein